MELFKTIAFTHKTTELKDIGRLHIQDDEVQSRLQHLKNTLNLQELLYISTCNRVEFVMVTPEDLDEEFRMKFFAAFNPSWTKKDIEWAANHSRTFEGERSLRHLFYVASSVDSLVVGEREIITQVRESYDICQKFKLTGDRLRLLVRFAVETAKLIYTQTQIAQHPVSVVSLAYRKMREQEIDHRPNILIIGAGQTNQTMGRYLSKAPYGKVLVYNRSLDKAENLATALDGKGCSLAELKNHKGGFDIIISCTGASQPVINNRLYRQLLGNDLSEKTIVDLAIPSDLEQEVIRKNNVNYIGIESLKKEARKNLEHRQKELERCKRLINDKISEFEHLLRERKVELSMKEIPKVVKEIRERAVNKVFNKDLDALDPESRVVLEKMMEYMEKKYISVPMKMAKEIMIKG
ncbi:MAG: glutamyl-tRNA reductase [Flavobacteriales bacterium]|jgi:glutamyl-tRNA reductase|nr:glutamyl-tRNA reductase [Flavobacteriales bacterium]